MVPDSIETSPEPTDRRNRSRRRCVGKVVGLVIKNCLNIGWGATDFDLSEEHNLTRHAIRDFAETEIVPITRELDANEEFSVELRRKMAKQGLPGCFVPEKYG